MKVDGSENERLYMPDGLIYFRLNLEELLVDICQLMGYTSFVTKVLIVYMLLLTLCFVVSVFLMTKKNINVAHIWWLVFFNSINPMERG